MVGTPGAGSVLGTRGEGERAGLPLPRTADLSLGKGTGPGFASDFVCWTQPWVHPLVEMILRVARGAAENWLLLGGVAGSGATTRNACKQFVLPCFKSLNSCSQLQPLNTCKDMGPLDRTC